MLTSCGVLMSCVQDVYEEETYKIIPPFRWVRVFDYSSVCKGTGIVHEYIGMTKLTFHFLPHLSDRVRVSEVRGNRENFDIWIDCLDLFGYSIK
jgi:hypothetical protein